MKHRAVESVMTPLEKVVCAHPHTSHEEIVRLLAVHRVSALPMLVDPSTPTAMPPRVGTPVGLGAMVEVCVLLDMAGS
jgi:hypothetical protein